MPGFFSPYFSNWALFKAMNAISRLGKKIFVVIVPRFYPFHFMLSPVDQHKSSPSLKSSSSICWSTQCWEHDNGIIWYQRNQMKYITLKLRQKNFRLPSGKKKAIKKLAPPVLPPVPAAPIVFGPRKLSAIFHSKLSPPGSSRYLFVKTWFLQSFFTWFIGKGLFLSGGKSFGVN